MSNFKKQKRIKIGSILKNKDGNGSYIKVNLHKLESITLTNGEFIELENAKTLLKKADDLEESGKISSEIADSIRAQADKFPDFVVYDLIVKRNA